MQRFVGQIGLRLRGEELRLARNHSTKSTDQDRLGFGLKAVDDDETKVNGRQG